MADEAALAALQAQARAPKGAIWIFGAGPVGCAVARAASLLPFVVRMIDSRAEALALAPPGVEAVEACDPPALLDAAPAGTAFVILTHSHALDFRLVERALERSDCVYVGMIGSQTKRAKCLAWLRARGTPAATEATRLRCPLGLAKGADKRPAIIAALSARQGVRRNGAQA